MRMQFLVILIVHPIPEFHDSMFYTSDIPRILKLLRLRNNPMRTRTIRQIIERDPCGEDWHPDRRIWNFPEDIDEFEIEFGNKIFFQTLSSKY
jgi:hypothetical protein